MRALNNYQLNDIIITVGDYEFKVNTEYKMVLDVLVNEKPFIDLLPSSYYQLLLRTHNEQNMYLKMRLDTGVIISQLFDYNDFYNRDEEKSEKAFDFKKDANIIIASFRHYYNINLLTDNLDFREFMLLLNGLQNTVFNNIMDIRTRKMPTGKEYAEERIELMKLKEKYSLIDRELEEQIESETKESNLDIVKRFVKEGTRAFEDRGE